MQVRTYHHFPLAPGANLSLVGGGEGWSTLLIVIIFHQFFEGLALGARIALLDFASRWTPWIMGMAFTLITPIGIAIGVGVHENFSANGKAPLLSVGILNSISAGILVRRDSSFRDGNDLTSLCLASYTRPQNSSRQTLPPAPSSAPRCPAFSSHWPPSCPA